MKKCSRCNQEKDICCFGKDKYNNDGLRYACNECLSIERKHKWTIMTDEEKRQKYKRANDWRNSLSNERREELNKKMRVENMTEEMRQLRRNQATESRERRPKEVLINGARQRAKSKNIEFTITKDDIEIPNICPVLGIPLIKGKGKLTDNSPTIDRIDNTKGYVKGNVAIISYRANLLKNSSSIKEMELILKYMKYHLSTV
jgi:hypothetical protein